MTELIAWQTYQGKDLRQGDLLPGLFAPIIPADFVPDHHGVQVIDAQPNDLLILSQSCDLENKKLKSAALCRFCTVEAFDREDPQDNSKWELVRQGRVETLHLLPSPTEPQNNRQALVIDFRHVYSLPILYLQTHAERMGSRQRLQSPYVEHLSQAFARFFMRVGLPTAIPSFRK